MQQTLLSLEKETYKVENNHANVGNYPACYHNVNNTNGILHSMN